MSSKARTTRHGPAETDEMERKSIMVDADVHLSLKRLAVDRGVPMHDLTRELLLWALQEETKPGKSGKVHKKA